MTPVWLLDVDGVLNAISRKGDQRVWPDWETGVAHGGGADWPILWSPAVALFVREVAMSGAAEVRWHTTWQHEAVAIERLLGLPQLEVAAAPEYLDRSFTARAIREEKPPWWKLPAAERVLLEEKRPLIWTDDDISGQLRNYVRAGATLISPNEHIGLSPANLRTIEEAL